ncbi:RDD family protein [Actinacidiphila bryophytorum]|uniref:RDD family protein n=1 Tax=Actinacidiphila bryophytorum TaxID=1436133 RepID=UPI002176EB74|nr:RDD family protein [Actinacidiphila bryophytorum]UWE12653.1 RDD family protein [Actinacidiphila bryophytorum]
MSGLGGQPEEQVPGYAMDLDAVTYQPLTSSQRYERGQLAHWFVRVASALIDALLVCWPTFVPRWTMSPGHHRTEMITYGLFVQIVLQLLVTVWEGRTGRSPGRALLRLRLVGQFDGRPLGFWRALGRRLAHLLDFLSCYLGSLWPLWDDQRQTFADKIARSVVVAEGNRPQA